MITIGTRVRVLSSGLTGEVTDIYHMPGGRIDLRLELDRPIEERFCQSFDHWVPIGAVAELPPEAEPTDEEEPCAR